MIELTITMQEAIERAQLLVNQGQYILGTGNYRPYEDANGNTVDLPYTTQWRRAVGFGLRRVRGLLVLQNRSSSAGFQCRLMGDRERRYQRRLSNRRRAAQTGAQHRYNHSGSRRVAALSDDPRSAQSAALHRACVDHRKRSGRIRCGFTRLPIVDRDPMLRSQWPYTSDYPF
jgi:hypothetical protein